MVCKACSTGQTGFEESMVLSRKPRALKKAAWMATSRIAMMEVAMRISTSVNPALALDLNPNPNL